MRSLLSRNLAFCSDTDEFSRYESSMVILNKPPGELEELDFALISSVSLGSLRTLS
jgi:hypothetical protein